MSANNDAYHLDGFTTLDVVEADSTSSTPVAGIQDVTIIPSVSLERLYTGDSIKIESQLQHEFQVQVEIGYSLWDVTLAQEWLGGGQSSTAKSMTDETEPQRFEVSFTLPSAQDQRILGGDTDGNSEDEPVKVTGITFEEMPLFDASRGEYAQWDLSGVGEDISQVGVEDTTV